MIKIGLTGADGFIGGHIVKKLKTITGVHIDVCNYNYLLDNNLEVLKKFVKNKDVIIHVAAATRGSNFSLISGNVVVTYNLLNAIKRFKSKAKIIFLSSSAVDVKKQSVYGESKKLSELMIRDFSELYNKRVLILRLTNVFGEGSKPFHNTVVATFCYQVANGEKLKINKKGSPLMLIYVDDVIKTIIKEIFSKNNKRFSFKRVYSKNIITVPQLAKLIKSFKNLKSPRQLNNKFKKNLYKTYLSYVKNK